MAEYETREVSRFETKEKMVRNNKTLLMMLFKVKAPACNSNNSAMMMPSSVICNQITAAPDSTDGLLSPPKVAGQC